MTIANMVEVVQTGDSYKLSYKQATCTVRDDHGTWRHSSVDGIKSYLGNQTTLELCIWQLRTLTDRENSQ